MPRPYNYAKQYHRTDMRREARELVNESTVPVASEQTYESYCAALGVDAGEARRATLVQSLAAYLRDDPIVRSLTEATEGTYRPWHGLRCPNIVRPTDTADWAVSWADQPIIDEK